MARRRIAQETFGFVGQLHAPIAWHLIECQLVEIYSAAKGEPAWSPLALFKALLLAVWCDLSDVKLAERSIAPCRLLFTCYAMLK
jgi:transposase, IS5 family